MADYKCSGCGRVVLKPTPMGASLGTCGSQACNLEAITADLDRSKARGELPAACDCKADAASAELSPAARGIIQSINAFTEVVRPVDEPVTSKRCQVCGTSPVCTSIIPSVLGTCDNVYCQFIAIDEMRPKAPKPEPAAVREFDADFEPPWTYLPGSMAHLKR
jgi:hypothetical protein